MECVGSLFAIIVGVIIYIASRKSPQPPPATRDPAAQTPLNGLFALFLYDRWLDGGAHGLFGDADDPQDAPYDDEDDRRDNADEDDQYWDDRAGF